MEKEIEICCGVSQESILRPKCCSFKLETYLTLKINNTTAVIINKVI